MKPTVYTPFNLGNPRDNAIIQTSAGVRIVDINTVLMVYGTRQMAAGFSQVSDSYVNMYTVGEGYEFYLISAQLTVDRGSAVSPQAGRLLLLTNGETVDSDNTLMYSALYDNQLCTTTTMNPCFPIRMVAGERLRLYNQNVVGQTSASIFGYLIDKSIIQRVLYRDY